MDMVDGSKKNGGTQNGMGGTHFVAAPGLYRKIEFLEKKTCHGLVPWASMGYPETENLRRQERCAAELDKLELLEMARPSWSLLACPGGDTQRWFMWGFLRRIKNRMVESNWEIVGANHLDGKLRVCHFLMAFYSRYTH